MAEYYEFHDFDNIENLDGLIISKAISLASAVKQYRYTDIINLFRINTEQTGIVEYIIIEIECDGVPPKNIYGIEFRERLALVVSDDIDRLVDVFALRKEFPVLIHQNDTPPGTPINLCLYFESSASVHRRWTPKNFIRRIKWWLEQSAKGLLHPSDQPVEHLFFKTKYELILPFNYDELQNNHDKKFMICRGGKRDDLNCTFFVEQDYGKEETNSGLTELFELNLPEVMHGHVYRDPNTLGGLQQQLIDKNIDLLSILSEIFNNRIDENGVSKSVDSTYTILLLHIPILREVGGIPAGITHKAFVIDKGFLKLGHEIGLLIKVDSVSDKYYIDSTEKSETEVDAVWHDEKIFAMEVLKINDSAAARTQSGIEKKGPKAVLIGAGSLGSIMLDMWVRSGWGNWSVIDKDFIKPHNLSRHIAYSQHIGMYKSDVVKQLSSAITTNADAIKSICADACDLSNKTIADTLKDAELIVDVSTTLEYPRLVSNQDTLPRHISTFVTPNGLSSVLLVEDVERNTRLQTLEAQYYRALIVNTWGKEHFGLNPKTFWSGASCRDLSFIMAYSKIINHGANLVEQIQKRSLNSEAFIGVWERSPDTGIVNFHETHVCSESQFELGEYHVYIDDGVTDKLNKFRIENLPNETGGIVLGYYDFNVEAIVVVDVLPAPVDSDSSSSWFERGTQGQTDAVNDAANRTAGIVGYIGEWHSHPDGCSTNPSRDDLIQLTELAIAMNEDGLPSVIIIVGEDDVNVLQGVIE